MGPAAVEGHDVLELTSGWELARAQSGQADDLESLGRCDWIPASVPGTVALALRDAERSTAGISLDDHDWWFRVRFAAEPLREGEEVRLRFGGIATLADVFLNGQPVLHSDSMFLAHAVDVGPLLRGSDTNELAICCRALTPLLAMRRRPRARWRTRLVSEGNLRFVRTMLLGRAPGFAPGPPVVGPWQPVTLERDRWVAVDDVRMRSRLEADDGVVTVQVYARALDSGGRIDSAQLLVRGPGAEAGVRQELQITPTAAGARVEGAARLAHVERWWPHTHGDPTRYDVAIVFGLGNEERELRLGKAGFRTLSAGTALERDGIQLRINDVPVFARGAVWTPGDLAQPSKPPDELRDVLCAVSDAGMNMIRVPGTACYESDAFYEICDELGILVWQDFMFANLDYPERDEAFMASVEAEARQLLARLGPRPSLAVLCGGSEVAQQVAMLGLDPALANGPLFGKVLPDLVVQADVDAPYVPSAPWGGVLPFRPDRGVANYYGVGGYRRPLEDVRRAEVKFAAECLAFSNVPDEEALEAIGGEEPVSVADPRWKAGVPRDRGAGWDFEDVRDHYLRLLFGVDPSLLRATDQDRYLELSRVVSGEVMAEVFGEWRRRDSCTGGGLVLWLRDLLPGAGWGLLDQRGLPKAAYHHLRRALAPVAVWSTDEGLGGIAVHLANDTAETVQATLRVALYRDFHHPIDASSRPVALSPHSVCADNVEDLLGRFVDVAWAYRFGPPAQDLVVLSLERDTDGRREVISRSFRLPAGRPLWRASASELGLTADVGPHTDGTARLRLASSRFAYGVRIHVPGFRSEDDCLSLEPGNERHISLHPTAEHAREPAGTITAVNLAGHLAIEQAR